MFNLANFGKSERIVIPQFSLNLPIRRFNFYNVSKAKFKTTKYFVFFLDQMPIRGKGQLE